MPSARLTSSMTALAILKDALHLNSSTIFKIIIILIYFFNTIFKIIRKILSEKLKYYQRNSSVGKGIQV